MMFTGCNSGENTDVSTKDVFTANQEFLKTAGAEGDSADTHYTFSEFKGNIIKWAGENNINVEAEAETYLVLSKSASGENKDAESFTFHTSIDFSSSESSDNSISTAATVMTAVGCVQNHGPVRAIFTSVKNGLPAGAAELDASYLECNNFIDVTYNDATALYNTFAANSDMTAVKDFDITYPTYTKAYKIKFKGVSGQSAYQNRGTYPNPIKTIGDLLASCQTSTVLFELASFNGGGSADNIPGKVTATIVLHENDVESFTKKFNNSYEKVEKHYKDIDDVNAEFEYTMTPVDLPSGVISKEDTENIVSLMYTMINGTYLRNDNDEVEAVSNIGNVSTENGQFKLKINAKSLNDETMTELEGVVETICGLSDIGYEKSGGTRVWTNAPETPLVVNISEAVGADCSSAMEMKDVAEFTSAVNKINLISWGTNSNDAAKDLEKIFEYMANAGTETATK